MRNIFLLLLAVNIFVFMFYFYLPDESTQSESRLPTNVEKLVLLSEVDKAALTSEISGKKQLQANKSADKDRGVSACFTIGPFREESGILAFQSEIKQKIKSSSVRERVEKLHWRYWVYLADSGSKEKAVAQASELAKKGLKDYYVVARGDSKNSISLGHFKDKLLAEKRLKAIKLMGYKPKIRTIEKEYTLYWLDYVVDSKQGLNSQTLDSFELEESIHQFNRKCDK
ncbi:MAG: SPOR domain-containing protein [Gammaproteobacteria bacterium]|nr:SPOR domain-containing protein [Gammaproteobacteria bacterium]